jgi:hypothetical protein
MDDIDRVKAMDVTVQMEYIGYDRVRSNHRTVFRHSGLVHKHIFGQVKQQKMIATRQNTVPIKICSITP